MSRLHSASILGAVIAALVLAGLQTRQPDLSGQEGPPDVVAFGRNVYISEGCIHCHSQFVRPVGYDQELWGTPTPVDKALAQEPVLIGNRRQGPDLANVGDRRTAQWNRLHLIDPRGVSPGSRMPSYDYLFKPGDPRGPALIAYLQQLKASPQPSN